MAKVKERQEDIDKMIDWINQQEDFFWLCDLRTHMGCANADERNEMNAFIGRIMSKLRKLNICQCSQIGRSQTEERKGSGGRQYVRIKIIESQVIELL